MTHKKYHRVKTKTVLQYEASECGAASLGTILEYYGYYVSLGELRARCGITRNGASARQILDAAKSFGLDCRAYQSSTEALSSQGLFPCIIFWCYRHFLVVEGFSQKYAYLSDPATGRVRVPLDEFSKGFTGYVLELQPSKTFSPQGKPVSVISQTVSLLWPFKNPLIQLALSTLVQTICSLFVAGLTATFIDAFLQNNKEYLGIPIIWLLATASLVWFAGAALEFLLLRRIEVSLSKHLASKLFRELFTSSYFFFQVRYPGEIAARLYLGVGIAHTLVVQIVRYVFTLLKAFIVMIAAFMISPWLCLLSLTFVAINLIFNWWLTDMRYDANLRLAIESGKVQGKGLLGISNIEAIKASGLEFEFLAQWQESFGEVVVQNQKLSAQTALSSVMASGSTYLLNGLIICLGGILIITGSISLGTLVGFQFLQSQLTSPLVSLPQLTSVVQRLIGNLGRLNDIFGSEKDPLVTSLDIQTPNSQSSSYTTQPLTGQITIRDLRFSFDPSSQPFIDDINIDIPAGSHVSIIGQSGSGKSTLMRLIAGLYQPTHGQILFDGLPWTSHGNEVMRQSLAYVPQEIFIFAESIYDNITLWNSDYDLNDLEASARDAQILNLIHSYPEGFLRQLRDNGSDLSGGERQRIELCRALVRQPSILLLDEATSALDNETQAEFLKALKLRNITVISIAQRLETAIHGDMIIFIKNGKIIESGDPQLLLRQDSSFSQLLHSERISVGALS